MTTDRKGGDLFVVDNSDPGWTGLRYLQEWCDLASSFDSPDTTYALRGTCATGNHR